MVNWQITAKTLYCEAVADEVTVMVHKNWSVTCTGYRKPGKGAKKLSDDKSMPVNRKLNCAGLECPQVMQYIERLRAEEARAGEKK
jgi:hypothetical protein